jgi:hypothetical protein
VDCDEEIEQDDSLVRTQGVTGHRGQWRGEPAGQQHQQAVWGLHTGQVMCHQQWQSCVAFSLKSSSSTCVTPMGSIEFVRVQGLVGHRGLRRGTRPGQGSSAGAGRRRLSWSATRLARRTASSASQSLGPCHGDIVQTSVLDSAGRPRAGFGDGDDVDDVVFYGSNRKRTPLSSQINPNPFTVESNKSESVYSRKSKKSV